jgi:hypothetical protein
MLPAAQDSTLGDGVVVPNRTQESRVERTESQAPAP